MREFVIKTGFSSCMSWKVSKSSLKKLFRQAGLLPHARSVWGGIRRLSDATFRREERQQAVDFALFCQGQGRLFQQRLFPPIADLPSVLVVNTGRHALLVELALVKACELAGFRPVVLAEYDPWTERYYRHCGVDAVYFWDEFLEASDTALAASLLASVNTFQHFVGLEYQGVRVGKYAASTALRHLRVGRLDLASPSTRQSLLPFLRRAVECAEASKRVLDALKPDLALTIDVGYSPRGELYDLCLAAEIDTITWNAAHRNNTLMFKRYNQKNRDVHPASLAPDTWETVKTRPWGAKQSESLREEIVGSYVKGEWYSEVGTQFHTRVQDAAEVRAALTTDPAKKTAVIFPHIFWDGTFFWGTDLFSSYEEWFRETMRVACANTAVNWIVKIHPANMVKNVRDGIHTPPLEMTAIASISEVLPGHIHVIQPHTPMSTLSLYSVMDYCVTVRGTVGIEAASFGIPVLTAGTGRFDRLGFTIDSDSTAQYLDRLAHIQDIPPLAAAQRELAERFAYGVFVQRPFHLRSVTLEYQRDAKASLQTRMCLGDSQDLRSAPDLLALSQWIHGGREDFVVEGVPPHA